MFCECHTQENDVWYVRIVPGSNTTITRGDTISQVRDVDNVKLASGSYHTLANGPCRGRQSSGAVGHLNQSVWELAAAAAPASFSLLSSNSLIATCRCRSFSSVGYRCCSSWYLCASRFRDLCSSAASHSLSSLSFTCSHMLPSLIACYRQIVSFSSNSPNCDWCAASSALVRRCAFSSAGCQVRFIWSYWSCISSCQRFHISFHIFTISLVAAFASSLATIKSRGGFAGSIR